MNEVTFEDVHQALLRQYDETVKDIRALHACSGWTTSQITEYGNLNAKLGTINEALCHLKEDWYRARKLFGYA